MDKLDERVLIYTGLSVFCSFAGVFAGALAAVLSFVQIAVVIELVYLIGIPKPADSSHTV